MKNTRYYPFERNRYFYGKLMTVRDFEAEQQYNNDKRRLINRLCHGAGIVAGLQVVLIDEKTVSVETGMALDYAGRELVVSTPQTLKLSAIEGFPLQRIPPAVYLCLAYDESGKEPVFSPTKDRSVAEQLTEYNRVAEQYRFFLISAEEEEKRSAFSFFEQTVKVVETEQFIVWLTTPKAVVDGETAPLTFEITTKGIVTEGTLVVSLNGEQWQLPLSDGERQTRWYTFSQQQQAYVVLNAEIIDTKGVNLPTIETAKVQLVRGSLEQFYTELYRDQPLTLLTAGREHLYLAKIDLLPAGTTYAIERVTPLPYEETITETHFFQQLTKYRQQFRQAPVQVVTEVEEHDEPTFHLQSTFTAERNEWKLQLGVPYRRPAIRVATGTVMIQWPEEMEKSLFRKGHDIWYSEELSHGLGEGDVFVDVRFGEENPLRTEQRRLYSEHASLWNGTEHELISEFMHSIIVFPHRGTFQIAVKNGRQNGVLHWRAMKEEWS